MTIDDIKKIANNKREELIKGNQDLKKIDLIIDSLEDNMFFFKTDINVAVPILLYIGISEEKVKDVYMSLLSPTNYKSDVKVRQAFDPETVNSNKI